MLDLRDRLTCVLIWRTWIWNNNINPKDNKNCYIKRSPLTSPVAFYGTIKISCRLSLAELTLDDSSTQLSQLGAWGKIQRDLNHGPQNWQSSALTTTLPRISTSFIRQVANN